MIRKTHAKMEEKADVTTQNAIFDVIYKIGEIPQEKMGFWHQ